MRVVADTNTVISGLLWYGAPRQLLNLAREQRITLFTSLPLLTELAQVLRRDKFSERLKLANVTINELVTGYAALAILVKPVAIRPVILADPSDDQVLACAIACKADCIVSGDKHLLDLGKYEKTSIMSVSQFLSVVIK
jgi:putative PIN family toxin of toxin-antitoxin system